MTPTTIPAPDMTGVAPGSAHEKQLYQTWKAEVAAHNSGHDERIKRQLAAHATAAGFIPTDVEQAVRHDIPVKVESTVQNVAVLTHEAPVEQKVA